MTVTLRNTKGSPLTFGELDENFNFLHGSATTVSLVSNTLTVSGTGVYIIVTEGASATDNLASITGFSDGDVLDLSPANSAVSVVVQHSAGSNGIMKLLSGTDFTMDSEFDNIILRARGSAALVERVRADIG